MVRITNTIRIDDTDKLREKVNEALAVFNEYVKTQKLDATGSHDASASDATLHENELTDAKA